MLTINFELTEEEFLKYNYYTAWQQPEKKNFRIRYYSACLLAYIFLTTAATYLLDNGKITTSLIIVLIVGSLAIVLLIRFRLKTRFDKIARKLIHDSGPGKILSKTALSLSQSGVEGKTPIAEVKYSWDAFEHKVTVNDCCYLYVNARQAVVIPLRAFSSVEQRAQFDKMLAEYLPLETKFKSAS